MSKTIITIKPIKTELLSSSKKTVVNQSSGHSSIMVHKIKTTVIGKQGHAGMNGIDGEDGQDGQDALNPYELAVQEGFVGTLNEWLESLKGQDGLNNYELAVSNGFVGTYEEWELTQHGQDGDPFTFEDLTPEQLEALKGDDAYEVYFETTQDDPKLTREQWSKSFNLVETFNSLSVAEALDPSDKLMILRDVGGVPTLYKVDKDALFNESILFSVRKIGEGSNNRAFRLRRSSDNNQQDIYFDVNGEISDNSLCENEQTFGVWRGADTLYLIIWYNQSHESQKYDAFAQVEWNFINGASNYPPIYFPLEKEIRWHNNNIMTFRNVFEVRNIYRRFQVFKNEIITSVLTFYPIEYWGWFETLKPLNHNTLGGQSVVEGGSLTFGCPNNVFFLQNTLQKIGGSKGGDGLQTHWTRIDGNDVAININRDGQSVNTMFGITGGRNGSNYTYRKEFRIYNWDVEDNVDIETNIKNYFNL